MTVAIRGARRSDLDRLVGLWREMWDVHAALDKRFETSPRADRAMKDFLEGHYEGEDSCILVAEEGGRPVGYALGTILENPPIVTRPRFGYVADLAVTAAARRQGIGASLLREMHDWFRGRGVTSAEVQVSVANAVAREFWRKHGYEPFLERMRATL